MSQSGSDALAQAISNAWNLTATELNTLLPYIGTPHFESYEKLRILYRIHTVLSTLLINKGDEAKWVRDPLLAFAGASPLNYILLHNNLEGFNTVYKIIKLIANWE